MTKNSCKLIRLLVESEFMSISKEIKEHGWFNRKLKMKLSATVDSMAFEIIIYLLLANEK